MHAASRGAAAPRDLTASQYISKVHIVRADNIQLTQHQKAFILQVHQHLQSDSANSNLLYADILGADALSCTESKSSRLAKQTSVYTLVMIDIQCFCVMHINQARSAAQPGILPLQPSTVSHCLTHKEYANYQLWSGLNLRMSSTALPFNTAKKNELDFH